MHTDISISAMKDKENEIKQIQSVGNFDPDIPLTSRVELFCNIDCPGELYISNIISQIKFKDASNVINEIINEIKQSHISKIWEAFQSFLNDKSDISWHKWIKNRKNKSPKIEIGEFTYPDDIRKIRNSYSHPYSILNNKNQNLDIDQHRKVILGLANHLYSEFSNSELKYQKFKIISLNEMNINKQNN